MKHGLTKYYRKEKKRVLEKCKECGVCAKPVRRSSSMSAITVITYSAVMNPNTVFKVKNYASLVAQAVGIAREDKLEPNTLDVAITKYELVRGGKFEIRISKSETNSNFQNPNDQNTKEVSLSVSF